ncbi:hypothetical protein AciM339_0877 [Aciduliprofundum sp. MAR08-339]|nr:hypothetical protein AciM339_0877 [Aciduliprofundum sp. MAR08-339]
MSMNIQGNILHEERIHFYLVSLIFIPLIFIFSAILLYQIFVAPIGSKPAPNWFFLLMIIIFLIFELGFHSYYLIITSDQLIVGFPMYKKYIPWNKIKDAKIDTKNAWRYGGYGIRVVSKKGKKTLVIIIPGTKKLTLKLKDLKWDSIVVSVKNVDNALNYIRQEIEIHK